MAKNIAHDTIIDVAKKRATLLRLDGELDVLKANRKLAVAELDLALANLASFAEQQLKFDLTPSE